MADPIWKDKKVLVGASPYVDYTIATGGMTIYSGRAYPKPGGTYIYARINDICANWLLHEPGTIGGNAVTNAYERTFTVTGVSTETVTFRNDWSYDDSFDPSVDGLSFPPEWVAIPGQTVVFTLYGLQTNFNVSILMSDGTTTTKAIQTMKNDGEAKISHPSDDAKFNVYAIYLSAFPKAVSVTVQGLTWKVDGACTARYALHYVNAYGGWDSFRIGGNAMRSDGVERHEYGRIGDNADTDPNERRMRDNFVNVLVQRWELHTGVMDDAASSRMHHLLNSPVVYLEDTSLAANDLHRVVPVVLTGTETRRLDYLNNGGRPVEYDITAELAEDRRRM